MRLFAYLLSGERSEKTFQPLKRFFLVVLSHWQCFFEAWQRKNFSACEKFFLTHSDILLWPHSIWLRVRVAQCAMALRVMVQSHLGWPWECHRSPDTSFGTILDEYPRAHGRSPPASAHECDALCHIVQIHAAGHGNIPHMKPVAGKMPSILQSILIQSGAKGGIRGLKAGIRKTMALWGRRNMPKKTFHRLKCFFARGTW